MPAIAPYYETDRALSEYLLFHYGADEQLLPSYSGPLDALHFPARSVTDCLELAHLPSQARALDLGCAVGRSAFELARHCTQVVGIDYSGRLVAAAQRLQQAGRLDFLYVEEGELMSSATAVVPPEIERTRVVFERGDGHELRPDLGAFDVILMANLIDRLRDPRRCLRQLPGLVRSGGQLIITSPYTWLTDFTPRENWLGGFEQDGRRIKTLDTLKTILSPHFNLANCKDLPFLIREHARKFQWSVAETSIWIRNRK